MGHSRSREKGVAKKMSEQKQEEKLRKFLRKGKGHDIRNTMAMVQSKKLTKERKREDAHGAYYVID
jgi:hypothetical protein